MEPITELDNPQLVVYKLVYIIHKKTIPYIIIEYMNFLLVSIKWINLQVVDEKLQCQHILIMNIFLLLCLISLFFCLSSLASPFFSLGTCISMGKMMKERVQGGARREKGRKKGEGEKKEKEKLKH